MSAGNFDRFYKTRRKYRESICHHTFLFPGDKRPIAFWGSGPKTFCTKDQQRRNERAADAD